MKPAEREFLNLTVMKAELSAVLTSFDRVPSTRVRCAVAPCYFPEQPYHGAGNLLLWSPSCSKGLTAFMPHVASGDYFVTECAYSRFGLSVFSMRSTSDSALKDQVNEFAVYEGGQRRRIVRAMRESERWDFYSEGKPLFFEDAAAYNVRRIRDRLRRSMIFSYFEKWGAPVQDPSFWEPAGACYTLVQKNG